MNTTINQSPHDQVSKQTGHVLYLSAEEKPTCIIRLWPPVKEITEKLRPTVNQTRGQSNLSNPLANNYPKPQPAGRNCHNKVPIVNDKLVYNNPDKKSDGWAIEHGVSQHSHLKT